MKHSIILLDDETTRKRMQNEKNYNTAMQQFLSGPTTALKVKDEAYPDRNSLYAPKERNGQ